MDTIGLLAAWVGIVSFLIATVLIVATNLVSSPLQRQLAKTSPVRKEKRIERLLAEIASSEMPGNGYIADLISLYGNMILTLIGGVAIVLISIQILDLGPALLAAVLPFSINSKLLTRATGVFLFFAAYLFIFRLCYLAVKIRQKTQPRKAGSARRALKEIEELRASQTMPTQSNL